ncbi:magnesium chelatase accessory protein [Palleronia salina]|uniref:Magnesium chelatase accessory protein n=1 Tax=Palleronia salina TaxID=313368 RepID=A0A1M6D4X7_9RHOB|nr:alpha/beta fold hydrolase BchO [Palleronia salina]SHI68322.1 magnesium chelatase accessory protein [Palleronia salina]
MDWARDARDWPNRAASRRVRCRPHDWHVQVMGDGPDLLLLHGTGGTSYGWAGVMPLLAKDFRVIAPDLPGHGFTRPGTRQRSRPVTMAEDLWRLMDWLGARPRWIVGHSAGGALAVHMGAQAPDRVDGLIGVNPALDGFQGAAAWAFPMAARAMAATPGIGAALSRVARSPARLSQIMGSTGSRLTQESLDIYARLLADPEHLRGTLDMMAQWSTAGLPSLLREWSGALVLMVGDADRTVSPEVSRRAARPTSRGEVVRLGSFGHLLAEEAPGILAEAISRHIAQPGSRPIKPVRQQC